MTTRLRVAVCILGLMFPSLALAEVHTFHETNGRTHVGTFQKVQGDRVFVKVRNKTSQLSFWSLSKSDQVYVIQHADTDPLAKSTLQPAEDPREWTDTRGNKAVGRLLSVRTGGIVALVVDGKPRDFEFANFSKGDQDYVRNIVANTPSAAFLPVEQGQPAAPTSAPTSPPAAPTFSMPTTSGPNTVPSSPSYAIPNNAPATSSAPVTSAPSYQPQPTYSLPDNSAPNNYSTGGISGGSQPQMHDAVPTSAPAPARPAASAQTGPGPMPSNSSASRLPQPNLDYYACSNCQKSVSASATRCPHCHVAFDYVEDANGNRRDLPGSGMSPRSSRAAIKIVVFLLVAVGGWLGRKVMGS